LPVGGCPASTGASSTRRLRVLVEQLREDWQTAVQEITHSDVQEHEYSASSEVIDTQADDIIVVELAKIYAKKCNSLLSYV
jgi:hypothetical protein